MTRHINLMRTSILPGQGRVQLPAFVLGIALTLVMGFGYLGYQLMTAALLQQHISSAQLNVEDSAQQLRDLRESFPGIGSEAELRTRYQSLQSRLMAQRSKLQGLGNQLDSATSGFARPLSSLTQHGLDGFRLTRIELRNSHSQLQLEGITRQPKLIPRYLDQLEGEVFAGLNIGNLDIEQSSDELWRFRIAEKREVEVTAEPSTTDLTLPELLQ